MRIDARSLADALNPGRIGGMDFLRAVAILLVIFSHLTEGEGGGVLLFAGLGVKIFFVLSGFLITDLLLRELETTRAIDLMNFYRRRAARLLPIFFLYLPIAVAVQLLRHRGVPWVAVLASILYVVNYYQAFTGAETNIVSHFWSLAVQEQFYALWPLALLAVAQHKLNLKQVLIIAIFAIWCWRWLLIGLDIGGHDYLYRALDTRADDLLTGGLFAALVRSSDWRAKLAALIGSPYTLPSVLTVLAVSNALGGGTFVQFGVVSIIQPAAIGIVVLWVIAASSQGGVLYAVLNQPLMVHIGRVSYSMYIFHGMVGYTTVRLAHEYTGSLWFAIFVAIAVIIAVATVISRVFETPLRRWIAGPRVPTGAPVLQA
mgnify:CR=1 FL=1